jgi:hypothetical protein
MLGGLKMFLSILIILMMIISSSFSHAEIVEVPLPGLHGSYPYDSISNTRTAHFQMDRKPLEVHNVWIRLSGIANPGMLGCEGYQQDVFGPFAIRYQALMKDSTSGLWCRAGHTIDDSSTTLDFTMEIKSKSGATWNSLKNGSGDITLIWSPLPYVLVCWVIHYPSANIFDAILVIDGEFSVPTEIRTWGRIKAIYQEE